MRILLTAALLISSAAIAGAQPRTTPPPPGNRVVARDGDVVVIEDDARVRIVRRREAAVRVVFDARERWLLLLADFKTPSSAPDGSVDHIYHYRDVTGTWPSATPWTGAATIEEYSTAELGNTGLGIATPDGLVQVRQSRQEWTDPNAVAVLTNRGGGGSGTIGNLTFDAAERWYVAELRRNDGVIRSPSGGSASMSLRLESGFRSGSEPVVPAWLGTQPPLKVFDVPPVMPEAALRANVRGIVVLAVTIAPDGTVTNARVLRSIPLLDAAAIEAVRQWRYQPSADRTTPVTVTVPVTF